MMSLTFNNNKKDNWVLNEPNYELSSNDYKSFSKIWKEVIDSCLYTTAQLSYDVLLVNDGSQLIYNAIKNPIIATIVDPLAYEYIAEECQNVLNTVEFKNTTDALGHKRSLVLIDESFTEAYEDCLYKNKYDLVFLNLKSAEDLTLKNVERYFTVLNDYGCLFIQKPNNIEIDSEVGTALEHYFAYLSVRVRSSTTGHSQSFIVYRKIQGLI